MFVKKKKHEYGIARWESSCSSHRFCLRLCQ